jgi:hypothetical protein
VLPYVHVLLAADSAADSAAEVLAATGASVSCIERVCCMKRFIFLLQEREIFVQESLLFCWPRRRRRRRRRREQFWSTLFLLVNRIASFRCCWTQRDGEPDTDITVSSSSSSLILSYYDTIAIILCVNASSDPGVLCTIDCWFFH